VSDFYDRQGHRLELMEWARLFEDNNYKRVALDEVGDYVVSTVWMGSDHNYWPTGRPLIFETMVFAAGDWNDTSRPRSLPELDMRRYTTEEEA
jgi:hypothetical protein